MLQQTRVCFVVLAEIPTLVKRAQNSGVPCRSVQERLLIILPLWSKFITKVTDYLRSMESEAPVMGHGTNIRKRGGGELKELVTGVLLEVKSVLGYGFGCATILDGWTSWMC